MTDADLIEKIGRQTVAAELGVTLHAVHKWCERKQIPWKHRAAVKRLAGRRAPKGFIEGSGRAAKAAA